MLGHIYLHTTHLHYVCSVCIPLLHLGWGRHTLYFYKDVPELALRSQRTGPLGS